MKRLKTIARLSDLTLRLAKSELGPQALAMELQSLLKDLGFAPGTQVALPGMGLSPTSSKDAIDQASRLFQYWQTVMDRPSTRYTPERKVALLARLRDGYTISQLKMAIDGCRNSPHHMGENEQSKPYNDLTLIMRNGSKVEDFMLLAGDQDDIDAAGGDAGENEIKTRRRLEAEAEKALHDGKMKKYEAIMERLGQ